MLVHDARRTIRARIRPRLRNRFPGQGAVDREYRKAADHAADKRGTGDHRRNPRRTEETVNIGIAAAHGELPWRIPSSPCAVIRRSTATREFAPPFLSLLFHGLFHASAFCSARFHTSGTAIVRVSAGRHSWAAERARRLRVSYPTQCPRGGEQT